MDTLLQPLISSLQEHDPKSDVAKVEKAFEVAKTKGVATIGFTGDSGGKIRELCIAGASVIKAVSSRQFPRLHIR